MSAVRQNKRKRKLNVLRTALDRKDEKLEEAKDVISQQNQTIATLQSIVDSDRLDISPQQMVQYSDLLAAKAHAEVDVGYIRTLLFPELYNSDIPQPLSCTSYCRFCEKKEYSIGSGTSGQGMLLWYPKVNLGTVLFMQETTGPKALSSWKVSTVFDCSSYFTQTCLVSASISVQYVGQLQTEQGYFVGSQLYGVDPSAVSADEIENGQFRVIAKPGEGIRLVYMPKDSRDFNYYPVDKVPPSATVADTTGFSGNAGAAAQGTDIELDLNALTYFEGSKPTSSGKFSIKYTKSADCIAIYWKGLKQNDSDVLRIDTMRRFNAFPKAGMRDFLDVVKPKRGFDQRKTIDVITDMQFSVPQLAGHSIKQMDRISDQIQAYLPNIGHLYNTGLLKEGLSLGGFASKLALESTGNAGFNTYSGRIWEND